VDASAGALIVGVVAAFVSGLAAIAFLLRYLRTRPTTVFVVYRLILAAVVVAWWLSVPR
jgi:undecaprenyl-diphosphatase